MVRLSLKLPVQTEAVAAARHCVGSLQRVLDVPALENVQLLVSELVTNSLRHSKMHAEGCVEIRVEAAPRRIRVEVRDSGEGFQPAPAPARLPGADETHGWGLYLVSRLAQRWGVERDGAYTDVWFELGDPAELSDGDGQSR